MVTTWWKPDIAGFNRGFMAPNPEITAAVAQWHDFEWLKSRMPKDAPFKLIDRTEEFCADYDQPAFDPGYDTHPLEHFEPLVRQLLSAPKRSIYMADDGRVHQTS